ncbi:MAG: ATP-binding protein [Lachnospiraceae bacterium]|nr:ATP-binding protein [Lachnospiraceae bacterium]
MFQYDSYFDEQLKNTPYSSSYEELEDYRNLLEMIVEDLISMKLADTGEAAYSRGVVITEKEMRDYFFKMPAARDRGGYYFILGESVKNGFDYIEARTKKTVSGSKSGSKVMLPIKNLRERYDLSESETLLMVLAIIAQTDRSYERIVGFGQDDVQQNVPTLGFGIALIRRAVDDSEFDVADFVSEERGLFNGLFMSAGVNSFNPLKTKLVLTGAALEYICGEGIYKRNGLKLLSREEEPVFFKDESIGIKAVLDDECMKGEKLFLACEDAEEVLSLVCGAAKDKGLKVYEIDISKIVKTDDNSLTELFDSLVFITGLSENVLLVSGLETDDYETDYKPIYKKIAELKSSRPIFMSGGGEAPKSLQKGNPVLSIKIGKPDVASRIAMWKHFLKEYGISLEKGFTIDEIADCYELSYSGIRAAAKQAKLDLLQKGVKKVGRDMITDALKGITTVNFNGLAKEVKTVYTWEDISMKEAERKLLMTACNRYKVKNGIGEGWGITKKNAYGNGVSVLLYGPTGTGKTMAAQVVAREVGLPLYRVDTSQLFSKYIGETQKNLNSVFDEADKSNVILFFDEADALFSKRTDVENSNDRYANQEIAFLLQRVEEYKGMSLLATNYYSGFDKAFVRRITYAVRLEQPDEEERLKLWTSILPDGVPVEKNIDFAFFAKQFELTGSNIKAILLSAAYMAGAEGGKLSVQHIVKAMKYEFDKLGMMPDSGKFGPYAAYLYV